MITATFSSLYFLKGAMEKTLGAKDDSSLETLTSPDSLEIKLQNLKL